MSYKREINKCTCAVCEVKRNPPTLDELRQESVPVYNIGDAVIGKPQWWYNELPQMDTVYSGNRCYMTQEPICGEIDPLEPAGVLWRDGTVLYHRCELRRNHKCKHMTFIIGIPGSRVPRHEW